MIKFFESNQTLRNLTEYLKENAKNSGIIYPQLIETKQTLKTDNEQLIKFIENRAANKIKNVYQKIKVKKKININAYDAYLSMVEKDERLLSSIMFGRHQAELPKNSKERMQNPYIHEQAHYHRDDELAGILLKNLLNDFKINKELQSENFYIPITVLKNVPIEDIIKKYFQFSVPGIEIIKGESNSIVMLSIPRANPDLDEIKYVVRACGLVASPWEIARNIKNSLIEFKDTPDISLGLKLPDTKKTLLNSSIFSRLNSVADSERHATNKLATSLRKLLLNLPELDSKAIKRIALMIDLTHTFYECNYQKYAFCLYVVIHEISLSLLKQRNSESLENDFSNFMIESKSTLLNAMNLSEKQLSKMQFVASPAMSGTNAYALAMQLADTMKTRYNRKPTIKVIEPCYYEFQYITEPTRYAQADIYTLSAGPIVNPHGLIPGVDINLFVKRNIIDFKREQPVTLIIDATTALYKNLKLDPEVQKRIEEGKLSIIIHESHQKFGLLHSDQAQYGRMFGLCSKESYASEAIEQLQTNAKQDFNKLIDMQVGAFISNTCSDTLEKVKQQHFTNGALLRTILVQSKLASKSVVEHEDMLKNVNELYFVNADHLAPTEGKSLRDTVLDFMYARDSFGHFNSTRTLVGHVVDGKTRKQIRISPDASDDIDCLIQTSQIYLAQHYSPKQLLDILIENARKSDSLPLEYQISALALINNITASLSMNSELIHKKRFELYGAMSFLIDQCPLLKNRQYYLNARNYLEKLRKTYGLAQFDLYMKHRDIIDPQRETLNQLTDHLELLIKKISQNNQSKLQIQCISECELLKSHINKLNLIVDNPKINQSQIEKFDVQNTKINEIYLEIQKETLTRLEGQIENLIKEIPLDNQSLFLEITRNQYKNNLKALKLDINELKNNLAVDNLFKNQTQLEYFEVRINNLNNDYKQNNVFNLALEPCQKELAGLIKLCETANSELDEEILRLKSKPNYMNNPNAMVRIDALREIKEVFNLNKRLLVDFENTNLLLKNKNPEEILKEFKVLKLKITDQVTDSLSNENLAKLTFKTQHWLIALNNEKIIRPLMKFTGHNLTSQQSGVINKTEVNLIQIGIEIKANLKKIMSKDKEVEYVQEKYSAKQNK